MSFTDLLQILGLLPWLGKLRPFGVRLFYSLFPATKRAHFKELRSRLRQMPFIYKPLGDKHFGENLLADYVQMQMRPIDLTTLQSNSGYYQDSAGSYYDDVRSYDLQATYEMVRSNRTCVIFGHAGVGKTTFTSYSVLSVINRLIVTGFYPFNLTEHLVPFVVPLKVVDETEPYPILSYLLRSNRYLASWGGANRLIRLCRKGKVLIVLDGYDEVYGSANSESTLRTEIDAIFEGAIPKNAASHPTKNAEDFYYHLTRAGNRVWLTTRKDFYRHNRLLIESKLQLKERIERWMETRYKFPGHTEIGYSSAGDPGIASIEILGIWERAELARKIFDKYRMVDPNCNLDEQEFLSFVDSYYDDETRKLSLNPLFLTVMCYVYVQNKIEETQSDGNTLRDLVSECVGLLVQELDQQRVRLPVPRAGKALKDRLAFPKEKIGFLRYFASRCFYEKPLLQQKVFTEKDLVEAAIAYARVNASNMSPDIARKPASFIKQLVYQGVFVVVDESVDKVFYDFPHRRFREILAVQYWDQEEAVSECLSMIAEPHFAEFILVFFATSLKFQDVILREMLRGIDETHRGEYLAGLASTCLDNAPNSYSPQKTIGTWVQQMAKERTLGELPTGIVNHFTPDQELVARFFLQLGESRTRGDQNSVRLYATFLAQISPQTLQELLRELVSVKSLDVSRTVCEVILKHRREFAPTLLRQLDDEEFDLLCNVAVMSVAATERQWWLQVLRCLSQHRLGSLKAKAESNAPDVAACIRALENREELVDAIVQFLNTEMVDVNVTRKSDAYDLEEAFGIQRSPPVSVEVVFEQNFLSKVEPPMVAERCKEVWLARSVREFIDEGEREFLRKNPKYLAKRIIVTETTVRITDQRT